MYQTFTSDDFSPTFPHCFIVSGVTVRMQVSFKSFQELQRIITASSAFVFKVSYLMRSPFGGGIHPHVLLFRFFAFVGFYDLNRGFVCMYVAVFKKFLSKQFAEVFQLVAEHFLTPVAQDLSYNRYSGINT